MKDNLMNKEGINSFIAPISKPQNYIYIRDDETGEYQPISWQSEQQRIISHTNFISHNFISINNHTSINHIGVHLELLCYTPFNKNYEVWKLKIKNTSDIIKKLSIVGYTEFINESRNMTRGKNNCAPYTFQMTRTCFRQNKIIQVINERCFKYNCDQKDIQSTRFFGIVGSNVSSYNGDTASFIGRNRNHDNPIAIEKGECNNTLNYNNNGCGALHTKVVLLSGENKEIIFILGQASNIEADLILKRYENLTIVNQELEELKCYLENGN